MSPQDTAQAVYEAANEVGNHYAQLFNKASGAEQEIYGEVCDAFRMFQQELMNRLDITHPPSKEPGGPA